MYRNIGAKIKTLAAVLAWVGIIVSVIAGIVMIGIGVDSRDGEAMMALGLGYIVLGPLLSWISSLVLYGFGELVDRSKNIDEKLD